MARSNLVVGVWVAHLIGRGPVLSPCYKVRRHVLGEPALAIRLE